MQPEINIGPLTLQTFGICFALGFIAAGMIMSKRLGELKRPPDWAYEIVFAALIGGLVGARLYWMVENWDEVSGDFFGSIFEGAGLVWYGGAIGGAIGVLLWGWWRGFLGWALVDACTVPLAVGYAIGRIGCQLAGDGDYGKDWDGPWAMAYPDGTVPIDTPVHPTPIYETVSVTVLALIIWRLRDKVTAGMMLAMYLFALGLERFLVEFLRRNEDVLIGLTQAQVLSLVMILAGGGWIAIRLAQGRFWREPEAEAAPPAPRGKRRARAAR